MDIPYPMCCKHCCRVKDDTECDSVESKVLLKADLSVCSGRYVPIYLHMRYWSPSYPGYLLFVQDCPLSPMHERLEYNKPELPYITTNRTKVSSSFHHIQSLTMNPVVSSSSTPDQPQDVGSSSLPPDQPQDVGSSSSPPDQLQDRPHSFDGAQEVSCQSNRFLIHVLILHRQVNPSSGPIRNTIRTLMAQLSNHNPVTLPSVQHRAPFPYVRATSHRHPESPIRSLFTIPLQLLPSSLNTEVNQTASETHIPQCPSSLNTELNQTPSETQIPQPLSSSNTELNQTPSETQIPQGPSSSNTEATQNAFSETHGIPHSFKIAPTITQFTSTTSTATESAATATSSALSGLQPPNSASTHSGPTVIPSAHNISAATPSGSSALTVTQSNIPITFQFLPQSTSFSPLFTSSKHPQSRLDNAFSTVRRQSTYKCWRAASKEVIDKSKEILAHIVLDIIHKQDKERDPEQQMYMDIHTKCMMNTITKSIQQHSGLVSLTEDDLMKTILPVLQGESFN